VQSASLVVVLFLAVERRSIEERRALTRSSTETNLKFQNSFQILLTSRQSKVQS